MMTNKVIFLDIDGTILGFDGKVRDSAREAIRRAKANGHKLIVCTGRSGFQIIDEIMSMGFDGVISSAGAHVVSAGREIYHHCMEVETSRPVFEYLEKNRFAYAAHCSGHIAVNRRSFAALQEEFRRLMAEEDVVKYISSRSVIREDVWNGPELEKIVFYRSPFPISRIRNDLQPGFDVVQFSLDDSFQDAGEITSAGVNKATGMQVLLDSMGIDRADSLAVGDGPNDREMIEFAGVGIAMGNAGEELKRAADFVTDSIERDGVWKAFQRYGLIGGEN
jgi:Cof subfamily protein (haloacid dehalogenase superfamily)